MPDVLLHEAVPEELGRPVPGEDNTARINAAIARLSAAPGFQTGVVRGVITVDGTLGAKDGTNVCIRNEEPGSGFQWLTDTGPNRDWTAQNNRAHWRWTNSDNCWTCGLTLTGTHEPGEPGRSPDEGSERDIWEGQAGFHFVGGRSSGAVGCHVRNIWGDGYNFGAYSPTGKADALEVGDGHSVLNCTLDRNGRAAVLMNGVKNLTVDGLDATNVVSSYYHVEVATNPRLAQSNLHLVRGKYRRGRKAGGRFVTMTSGADISDLFIEDNHLVGEPFLLQLAAKGDTRAERWDRVTIARNFSDTVCTSDEFITAWKIDGLFVNNNVALRDAKCKVLDADGAASCTNVTQLGNKFTIVT